MNSQRSTLTRVATYPSNFAGTPDEFLMSWFRVATAALPRAGRPSDRRGAAHQYPPSESRTFLPDSFAMRKCNIVISRGTLCFSLPSYPREVSFDVHLCSPRRIETFPESVPQRRAGNSTPTTALARFSLISGAISGDHRREFAVFSTPIKLPYIFPRAHRTENPALSIP